jgi:hypothetical protein
VTHHPNRRAACPEEEQKRLPVAIGAEDGPAFIAAGSDVVESIAEFES